MDTDNASQVEMATNWDDLEPDELLGPVMDIEASASGKKVKKSKSKKRKLDKGAIEEEHNMTPTKAGPKPANAELDKLLQAITASTVQMEDIKETSASDGRKAGCIDDPFGYGRAEDGKDAPEVCL
ncbi:hypothetical protein OIV83_001534 [Microbotryomycetes sp. JL201]|nr:hypothetical protein OIV83_001534 [Microbotryomycetes sp. JL201]